MLLKDLKYTIKVILIQMMKENVRNWQTVNLGIQKNIEVGVL